jgi:hypothetical protein
MLKKTLRFSMIFLLLLGLSLPVSAQWVIDLTVPLYGQETSYWCGAASAQMIMDGYPNPNDCLYIPQQTIWDVIQDNNLPNEPANWATDPHGLQQALMILNPPTGGTWALMTNPSNSDLMFQVLYWMNRNHYPVTTLVYRAAHWIVIVGYETDIEPVYNSDPTLQMITINDPWPPLQGVTSTMTGTAWFSNYWYGTVNAPGTWYGQYVAIIEPPQALGQVEVDMEIRIGDISKVISPEEAVKYAFQWIGQKNLSEKDSSYSLLADKTLYNLDPVLVREESKFDIKKGELVPYYYIVPFGSETDIKNGLASVCVIVNAFSGNFEEVGAFGKSVGFIRQDKAVDAFAKALDFKSEELKDVQAEVVFVPSELSYLRIYPLWRVEALDRVAFIEMSGIVHIGFEPVPAVYGK